MIYAKPNENYKLLGTEIKLDKNKLYTFIPASNIPNYKEKGLIFLQIKGSSGCGFLLNKNDYKLINKG